MPHGINVQMLHNVQRPRIGGAKATLLLGIGNLVTHIILFTFVPLNINV